MLRNRKIYRYITRVPQRSTRICCIRNSRERGQKAGEYLQLGIFGENQAKGKNALFHAEE